VFKGLKTNITMNYISRCSSYHTVNTLCLDCKTNQLMSCRKMIIIYSAIHMKRYTLCHYNIIFLSVTPGGM